MSEWFKEEVCKTEDRRFESYWGFKNFTYLCIIVKYNTMEEKKLRQGTIAWHEAQIEKIRSRSRGKNQKKDKEPIPNRGKVSIKYDFLKYIRVVMKWAVENSTLTRPQIELILYLYGMGTFSKKQFQEYHKTVGMYEQKTLDHLTEEGWIILWRPANKKKKEHALYTISHSGKLFCTRVHKICCGLEEITTDPKYNKLASNKDKRINSYYMDIIKKMNLDKAPQ